MSQRNDADLEKFLKGESAISALYKRGGQDGPSAALDQTILAHAQHAVDEKPASPLRRPRPTWLVPLSIAATVMLGINLAFNLRDFRQDTVYEETGGLIYSDSERSPSGQNPPRTGQAPLANGAMTNAPVDAHAVPRTDTAPHIVQEPPASKTEPGRWRAPPTETRDQQRRPEQAITSAAGRQFEHGNANSVAPTAQKETDQSNDFAPPPPAEATQKTMHETALQVEDDRARQQRRTRGSNEPAPEAPALQGGETDKANVPEADVSRGRLRQLQTVPQAAATTANGDGTHETIIIPLPRQAAGAADADVGGDRTISAAEALRRGNEAGDPLRSEFVSPKPAPPANYLCDLERLRISQEAINQTRQDVLTAIPPLNAHTWILEIQRLASEEAYADACRNLAAYIATFGRTESTGNLSVKLPE